MPYQERVGNLHIHTTYSDGTGSVQQVAAAANEAGLDFVIITDHNAYQPAHAGWYGRTLVLVGQELHDPTRPNVNHLLVFGAGRDLYAPGASLQECLDAARAAGALAFLAHPNEHSGAFVSEPEINWVDRDVTGYHGLELWNYMSEFKAYLSTRARALLYAFWPALAIRGPFPETLQLWDRLLEREMVYAVGGSDAHAGRYRMGPLQRTVFGYRHLFHAVNMHLLLRGPWRGKLAEDEAQVYDALRHGRGFIGYDALAPTSGARLVADSGVAEYTFGEVVPARQPVWLRARVPAKARLRLLRNGAPVQETHGHKLELSTAEPGVYRLEAYRRYAGLWRGWIFGNPIRIEYAVHGAGQGHPGARWERKP